MGCLPIPLHRPYHMTIEITTTKNRTSSSIPIVYSQKHKDEEKELGEETILADIRDYAFYKRIVDGIQKQLQYQKNIELKYENQVLIDHIIDTRRCNDLECRRCHQHNFPAKMSSRQNEPEQLNTVECDELIFDIDL